VRKTARRHRLSEGRYVIRLDDIAPNMNWDEYFRARRIFDMYGIKPLLGVIPDNQDPSLRRFPTNPTCFWEEMREAQRRGWEIAMHGYQHVYDSRGEDWLGVGNPSEFAGHDLATQLSKLRNAKAIFDREGLNVRVFFAPSHSFDGNTVRALKAVGIQSISDGYGLFPFRDEGILFVPQLIGRAVALPFGVYTSCYHLNTIDEARFRTLERFVERYHSRIVSYAQAEAMATDDPWNRACGAALRVVLRTKRQIGGLLDRDRWSSDQVTS
jgi:predicted deacetylase